MLLARPKVRDEGSRIFPNIPEAGMSTEQKRPRSEVDGKQMGDEEMSSGYEGHMSKRQKTDDGMHGISGRVMLFDHYGFVECNKL